VKKLISTRISGVLFVVGGRWSDLAGLPQRVVRLLSEPRGTSFTLNSKGE